jgi:hypothetical protein
VRRVEWIGDGTTAVADEPDTGNATMSDFAHGQTEAVLAAEPRLRTIAMLVEKAGPLTADEWREVGVLVAAFLGQARRVPQLVAVTGETAAVAPVLMGETTRRRYMSALRDLTGQVAR